MDAPEFLAAYLDTWNRHDSAGVAGYFGQDATYTDQALGQTFRGPAEIEGFVAHMEASFSTDYTFEMGKQIVTEDAYAMEWIMKGTNDRADAAQGLPATRKQFSVPGISLGTLSGGKISENTDYWSLATYLMQVGLMSPPGA